MLRKCPIGDPPPQRLDQGDESDGQGPHAAEGVPPDRSPRTTEMIRQGRRSFSVAVTSTSMSKSVWN